MKEYEQRMMKHRFIAEEDTDAAAVAVIFLLLGG